MYLLNMLAILPMITGDLLAGWRVLSADYDAGVAEFVNEKI